MVQSQLQSISQVGWHSSLPSSLTYLAGVLELLLDERGELEEEVKRTLRKHSAGAPSWMFIRSLPQMLAQFKCRAGKHPRTTICLYTDQGLQVRKYSHC